jgi:hypothetical protein
MNTAFWRSIVDGDYAVPPPYTAAAITTELLPALGSPDPTVREQLAYAIIARWIYDGRYAPAELRALVAELTPHLVLAGGVPDLHATCQRSYAALVLTDLLGYDSHAEFLTSTDVQRVLGPALAYFAGEEDARGYVPEYGFLAASVHAADLLWVLANNRYVTAADLERLLTAVAAKVTAPATHVAVNDLAEHQVRAVLAALHRDVLALPILVAWVASLAHPARHPVWDEAYREEPELHPRYNAKVFLCSLYLQLAFPGLGNLRFIEPPAIAAVLLPHVVVALNSIMVWN